MAETNPTAKRASWLGWAVLAAASGARCFRFRPLIAAFANVAPSRAGLVPVDSAAVDDQDSHRGRAHRARASARSSCSNPKAQVSTKPWAGPGSSRWRRRPSPAFFITGLNGNFYSFIHLLSGWTIIGLPMAIYAIRNRKVDAHKRAMTGMFVGGLLIVRGRADVPSGDASCLNFCLADSCGGFAVFATCANQL